MKKNRFFDFFIDTPSLFMYNNCCLSSGRPDIVNCGGMLHATPSSSAGPPAPRGNLLILD